MKINQQLEIKKSSVKKTNFDRAIKNYESC
jgi:hypothetical protein